MKVTSIRDFRDKATAYFKEDEPILITRHGKVAGLYIPLEDADSIPLEVRKELLYKFGEYISRNLEKSEAKEEDIIADFTRFRKARR
ncbi:MAG: type II toxin-antitoxin system Phd/YefM family antitoxin [Actinobacteria bacterium]|nr:type II toxin-antitoxin system Phd/YefM family antitoxin [Actinomycetota bacterium]